MAPKVTWMTARLSRLVENLVARITFQMRIEREITPVMAQTIIMVVGVINFDLSKIAWPMFRELVHHVLVVDVATDALGNRSLPRALEQVAGGQVEEAVN